MRVRDAKQSKQWHKIYVGVCGVCEQGTLVSWASLPLLTANRYKSCLVHRFIWTLLEFEYPKVNGVSYRISLCLTGLYIFIVLKQFCYIAQAGLEPGAKVPLQSSES